MASTLGTTNFLVHQCNLEIGTKSKQVRLTGIVGTIGPACKDPEILEEMFENGLNVARLNFSHGTHEYHAETIKNIRFAMENYGTKMGRHHPIAIAIDTKGSEIRTGILEHGSTAEVVLEKGATIALTTNTLFAEKCSTHIIYIDYTDFVPKITPGMRIYIDDGLISLICTAADLSNDILTCVIENGGHLGSSKGVNVPGIVKNPDLVTDRDRKDLLFAAEQQVDLVFTSFTRSANEVRAIRQILSNSDIHVVAKIENAEGVSNMDEIIMEADGIMIDRGDLGMEIGFQKVGVATKKIVAKCVAAGKPIIVATHFLESMVDRPRPTRAESSDVANAVLDGADCVMLSGETAKGRYPVLCVQTMSEICIEAESALWQRQLFIDLTSLSRPPLPVADTVAIAAVEASVNCLAPAIIVVTKTGRSAQLISKYRPKCPILAVTHDLKAAKQLNLYRAVVPLHFGGARSDDWRENVDARVQDGINFGKSKGFIKTGDLLVVVTGWKPGPGFTNSFTLMPVE